MCMENDTSGMQARKGRQCYTNVISVARNVTFSVHGHSKYKITLRSSEINTSIIAFISKVSAGTVYIHVDCELPHAELPFAECYFTPIDKRN